MTEKTYKYYAVVDEGTSRSLPFSLLRRVVMPDGGYGRDEAMSYAIDWEYTTMLRSSERGDTQFEFVEVDEDEAMQIKERLLVKRREWESQKKQASEGG